MQITVKATKQVTDNTGTKQGFSFCPNKLTIQVVSSNIEAGTAEINYQLEETGIKTEGYLRRSWIDNGNIIVPLSAIAGAMTDGVPNVTLINQILAPFNLELDA